MKRLLFVAMALVVLLVSVSPAAAQSEDHRGPFGVGFDIRSNGVEWIVRAPEGTIADRMVMNIRSFDGKIMTSVIITLMGEDSGFSAFEGGRSFPTEMPVVVDFTTSWNGKTEVTSGHRTIVR